MYRFLIPILILPLLVGGCLHDGEGSSLDTIRDVYGKFDERTIQAVGITLEAECKRSMANRQEFVDKINDHQQGLGKTARAVPQDCNGDGEPDF